jgi:hypothetical protein
VGKTGEVIVPGIADHQPREASDLGLDHLLAHAGEGEVDGKGLVVEPRDALDDAHGRRERPGKALPPCVAEPDPSEVERAVDVPVGLEGLGKGLGADIPDPVVGEVERCEVGVTTRASARARAPTSAILLPGRLSAATDQPALWVLERERHGCGGPGGGPL